MRRLFLGIAILALAACTALAARERAGSTGGQRHFTGSTDLDVLLNPGESISVFLFRNDNLGSQSLNFSRIVLVGYLVDANP